MIEQDIAAQMREAAGQVIDSERNNILQALAAEPVLANLLSGFIDRRLCMLAAFIRALPLPPEPAPALVSFDATTVEIPDDEPRQIVCTGEAGSDIWQPAFGTWETDDFGIESNEPIGDGERLFVNRRIYDALFKSKNVATALAVKVKPLVWVEWDGGHRSLSSEFYQIWTDNGGSGAPDDPLEVFDGFMLYNPHMIALGVYPTIEAAQAAAQADHESRIRAEIIAEPIALAGALAVPEIAAMVEAAMRLKSDMLERAEMYLDAISGEEYRIVKAGNGAWTSFCAALAALTKEPKT